MLPLLWSGCGASNLRCTICCRCCGLEVVPQCWDVRFVAVALAPKWCPHSKKYDLLPLLWFGSGASLLRCTTCCRCFGLEVVPKCFGAPLLRFTICYRCFHLEAVSQFYDVRFVAVALVSEWCPIAKMHDVLPLLWSRIGDSMLRWTICCRCFGFEVVPHAKTMVSALQSWYLCLWAEKRLIASYFRFSFLGPWFQLSRHDFFVYETKSV